MKRLAWHLQRNGASLALWLGCALIAGTLLLHALVVRPLEAEIETLRAQRTGVRDNQLDRLGNDLRRSDTAADQLARFYSYFARDGQLTERLGRVHETAQSLGLELKRADYKLISVPERKLDRYQMMMPLQGSYPVVRRFITTVLREQPTLAIEQVQFQRKDIAVDGLDAQISITFYLPK